ncbi:hypothetical protein NIES2104_08730 [Leptolyngbya sp. NIES-2104]|nr:hypothetical protein NIES2104_08730 [Leptolyngbya sp. NIES-2104]
MFLHTDFIQFVLTLIFLIKSYSSSMKGCSIAISQRAILLCQCQKTTKLIKP